ncbi:MAG: hypothetical protein LC749_15555, partial [Actinobacteria bacterium]|nr:hypothetical protein [Actinomycetota bacterium]
MSTTSVIEVTLGCASIQECSLTVRVARIESEPTPGFAAAIDGRTRRPAHSRARRVGGLHLPRREQKNPMKAIIQDKDGSPDV